MLQSMGCKELDTNEQLSMCLLWFSHVQLFATQWTATHQASLTFAISTNLLKFMSNELVMLSNHLILCHPSCPPAFNLAQHQGLFQ